MKKVLMVIGLLVAGFVGGTVLPGVLATTNEEPQVADAFKECAPTEIVIHEDNSDTTALVTLLTEALKKNMTEEEIKALIAESHAKANATSAAASKSKAASSSVAASSSTIVNEFNPVFNPVNNVTVDNNNTNTNTSENSNVNTNTQEQIQDTKVVDKEKDEVIVTPAPTPEEPKEEKPEKDKNNNGLGNGSEPADGSDDDVKGEDPSNPAHGDGEHPGRGKDKE